MLRLTFYGLYVKIRLYYRIEKGGEEMDNCTFEALETERKSKAFEEYRFTFIRYLEVAEKLLGLKKEVESIANMQCIRETGRALEPPETIDLQKKQALEAERVLSRLYDLDRSESGFDRAKKQFDADVLILSKHEKLLWNELTFIVSANGFVNSRYAYGKRNLAWVERSAEKHHALLIDDDCADERVRYYLKRLREFDKQPMPPVELEIAFRLSYGHLIDAIPFRVQ